MCRVLMETNRSSDLAGDEDILSWGSQLTRLMMHCERYLRKETSLDFLNKDYEAAIRIGSSEHSAISK